MVQDVSQEAIPVPEGPVAGHPCAWCGSRPARLYQLEDARFGKAGNHTRVMKRRAVEAYACEQHIRGFESQRVVDE